MPHTSHVHSESEHFRLTWPIGLTMLRLMLLPVFLYIVVMDARDPDPFEHRWWALGIFAVMAATDKLDGYLARRMNQTTKLGALLDPIADKLLVASSVVLLHFPFLAGDDYVIPLWVVAAIYAKDLIVALGALAYLLVVGNLSVKARLVGKLSTVLQLALVIATMLGPLLPRHGMHLPTWVLPSLWIGVTIVAAISCGDYLWQGFTSYLRS